MGGARQHTLPRFLLRGFASETKSRDGLVWYYRKGQQPVRTGIAAIAVEKNIYDQSDGTSADPSLTAREGDQADLIRALRERPVSGVIRDGRLVDLLVTLSLRTRGLRAWTSETMAGLLDHVGASFLTPAILRSIFQDSDFVRRTVGKSLEDMRIPADTAALYAQLLEKDIHLLSGELFPAVCEKITEILGEVQRLLPDQLRDGHNAALANLQDGPRQAAYRKMAWHLIRTEDPVILGDSAVVVNIDGEQPFKPLNDEFDTIRAVYLPIAPKHVIVGTPSGDTPKVDVEALNLGIARCSYEFFVAKEATKVPTPSEIGMWAGILTQDEVLSARKKILDRLPLTTSAQVADVKIPLEETKRALDSPSRACK